MALFVRPLAAGVSVVLVYLAQPAKQTFVCRPSQQVYGRLLRLNLQLGDGVALEGKSLPQSS